MSENWTLESLAERIRMAADAIAAIAAEVWEPQERARLRGKAEGLRVALSYVEEELRHARGGVK